VATASELGHKKTCDAQGGAGSDEDSLLNVSAAACGRAEKD